MATAPLLLISFQRIYNGERMCFYKYKYILINVYLHIYISSLLLSPKCLSFALFVFFCWCSFNVFPFEFKLEVVTPVWQTLLQFHAEWPVSRRERIKKKKARKQQTKLKDSTVWFSFRNRDECVTTRWYCLLYQMASLLTWMYISVKIKWLKRNCSLRHCLRCEIALF